MDGTRGLAACIIASFHFLEAYIDMTGDGPLEALVIFFIFGGYGLAKRPLQLMMRPGDAVTQVKLLQTLSSSAFKRWFRLYVPMIIALAITTLCAHSGAFEALRPLLAAPYKDDLFPGSMSPHIPRKWINRQKQMDYWWKDVKSVVDIWPVDVIHARNSIYMWSIREEFRCSMHLYIVLLASASMKPAGRLLILFLVSQYHLRCGRYEVMLYFAGACLAQLELMWQERKRRLQADSGSAPPIGAQSPTFSRDLILQGVGLPIAAFLISGRSPGTYAYDILVPAIKLYYNDTFPRTICCAAGILIFAGCMLLSSPDSTLHRLLNSKLIQYICRRAFGMVLLQTIVLYSGVLAVPHLVWNVIGGEPESPADRDSKEKLLRLIGISAGVIANLVSLLWLSDIFTKTVIGPNEVFIKCLDKWLFIKDHGGSARKATEEPIQTLDKE